MDPEQQKDRFDERQRIDALTEAVNSIGYATESIVRILEESDALDPKYTNQMKTILTSVSDARSTIGAWNPFEGKPARRRLDSNDNDSDGA